MYSHHDNGGITHQLIKWGVDSAMSQIENDLYIPQGTYISPKVPINARFSIAKGVSTIKGESLRVAMEI